MYKINKIEEVYFVLYGMLNFGLSHTAEEVLPTLYTISQNLKSLHNWEKISLNIQGQTQTATQDMKKVLQYFNDTDIAASDIGIDQTKDLHNTIWNIRYELGMFGDHVAGQALAALQKQFDKIHKKHITVIEQRAGSFDMGDQQSLEQNDIILLRKMAEILNYTDYEIQWGSTSNQLHRACLIMDVAWLLKNFPESWVQINYVNGKVTMGKGAVTITN